MNWEQWHKEHPSPADRINVLESELQHARHSLEAQRVGIEALVKERDALKADIESRQKNLNIAMATVHRDAVEKQATIDELLKRVAELEEQIDVRDRVMNGYAAIDAAMESK